MKTYQVMLEESFFQNAFEIQRTLLSPSLSFSSFVLGSFITFFLEVILTAVAQYIASFWPPIVEDENNDTNNENSSRTKLPSKNKIRRNPITQYLLNFLFGSMVTALANLYLFHIGNYYEENIFKMNILQFISYVTKVLCSVIGLTLFYDLQTYVFHRVSHHPSLYLAYHSMHHEYVRPNGQLAGIYGDTLEFCFLAACALWPLCVFPPFPLSSILVYFFIIAVFVQFNHSGRKVEIPWLFYTARFHHYHHLKYKVNYCEHLWFWDWLFGTLYLPPNYS